jgi:hypothetical protein
VKKPDEIAFWAALRGEGRHPNIDGWERARALVNVGDKRAHYLAEKWSNAGWWESGVSLRSGWFTRTAPASITLSGHVPGDAP